MDITPGPWEEGTTPDSISPERDTNSKEAGFIRALTRTTAVFYRTVVFGSLPRRVPIKHIGVVTDRVATVLDTMAQLRQAKKTVEVHHHTAHPAQASASRLWTTARLYGHTLVAALPPLAQSVVLGTAVFSVYEEVKERSDELYGVHSGLLPECADPYHFARTLSSSTTAGGLAGTLHGVLFTAWQHGEGVLRKQHVPTRLPGTMASHAVSHATLFGVFEAVKHSLFVLTETDHASVKGMTAVATAGAIAGLAEESISFYTVGWEEKGVSSIRTAFRELGRPPPRVLLSAMLSGSLGFLAFEYGRDFVLRKHGDKEVDGLIP